MPKTPLTSAWVDVGGVEGDAQADRKHHGGPDRAVCLYALERIEVLAREGHPIAVGTTGENLTVAGLEWDAVTPGIRLRAGGALLEVSAFTDPCRTIRDSFVDQRFTRISQRKHPGWSRVYARVLEPGLVAVGDTVMLERGA